jgi:hypothetical protein
MGFTSSGSSSSLIAATARTAVSNRSITLGKASRKKPDTRRVTSTRGRFLMAMGSTSMSTTRLLPSAHLGRTPSSAKAWAMSSPPVRMVLVPQTDRPRQRSISPWSCRWRSTTRSAAAAPMA